MLDRKLITRMAELKREIDVLARRGDRALDRDDDEALKKTQEEINDAIVFLAGFRNCLELLESE